MQKQRQTGSKFIPQYFKIQILPPTNVQQLIATSCNQILTPSFRKIYKKDLQFTLFIIKINHEDKQWKVYRRLSQLLWFQHDLRKKFKRQIPAIPLRKQSEIQLKDYPTLMQFFDIFFKKVINVAFHDQLFQQFINLFPSKFGNGIIYSQVQLKKHSGGRYTQATCAKKISNTCCRNWRNRWFTVTDEGFFYTMKKKSFIIKEMLNFSHHFKIYCGIEQTGYDLGIQIRSSYRTLQLRAHSLTDYAIFIHTLKKSYQISPHKDLHRYASFSSIKEHCHTQYYIDGEQYFQAVKNELLKAKKYVYITDWMMTPYLQLTRPSQLSDRKSRLDYIFEQIAMKGVKIYIILYMQPKIALNNDSQFVEKYLQQMNKNIKVLRHPNFILIPFLWSHHEKLIVIDQKVGFLGGLDLCYGRWDTQEHKLVDQFMKTEKQELWKGADFCNFRISDIYTPRKFQVSNIDKKSQPRMPWHDICVKIQGGSVHDVARHFIQYWNFVNFQTKFDQRQLLMHAGIHSMYKRGPKKQKQPPKQTHASFRQGLSKVFGVIKQKIHLKRSKKPSDILQGMIHNNNQQQNTSKIPEQQITKRAINQQSVDLQLQQSQNQKQQKTTAKDQDQGERQYYDHYLHQKQKGLLPIIQIPKIQNIKNYSKKIGKKLNNIFVQRKFNQSSYNKENNIFNHQKRLIVAHEDYEEKNFYGNYKHQILRSASTWSIGLEESMPQSSIHHAYIDLIRSSKYFIYIENQFFISIQNRVCHELIQRIEKAYRDKQKFKVIIMMPLLPGFQGDITNQASSSVMRVQLHWQYATLCRSKDSIYKKLAHIQNLDDYFKVYSLRQHGLTSHGVPVTQQLYIHSKLMIIDDQKVILGSANINDRSLLGDRDSQIAILIQQGDIKKDKFGRVYSESAKKLRVDLYMEHFGFTKQQCQDFHDQLIWKQIKINAKNNTQIYRLVFGCYPDDFMKTIADVNQILIDYPQRDVYLQNIKHIKGHVVQFPLKFLQKQNLNLKIGQKQFLIPYINFT